MKKDLPVHADAMVLLMGSFPDRVLQAVDLYKKGIAGRLIIVEESMGPFSKLESRGAEIISNSEQARNSCVALGIPADSIKVLPGEARDTKTEAIVVRNYLEGNAAIDTLLLVSSPPHMRRASMIFKAAFRDAEYPVYIGCSPSAYSNFNAGRWWRRKEDVQEVLTEFGKILNFILLERKKM